MLQGKNDHNKGGIWCSLFLASKIKYCILIDDYGIISEHKTFTGYSDVNRNLDRKDNFKIFEDEKLVTKQALSSKKNNLI